MQEDVNEIMEIQQTEHASLQSTKRCYRGNSESPIDLNIKKLE